MKRVLVVTPKFAPCGGADSRRAEQLVPRFESLGWSVDILAAHCNSTDAERPGVHRIRKPRLTAPGWRSPGLRSLGAFDRAASALYSHRAFDLVLFSNTDFASWRLGPRWLRRWNVPFVLDWQDPWFTTYYEQHPAIVPPGGRVKFAIANSLARRWEAMVAPAAAGHLFVSDAYDTAIVARHPEVASTPREVIPISFEPSASVGAASTWRPDGSGSRYWAAVGRGGPDMAAAANALFRELAAARRATPARFEGLQLWFVGTDYAPPSRARKSITPIAAKHGLEDCVFEIPVRVSETDVRGFQRDAEALVLLGSDDPGYMPSKLFGDLATGKPLVAAFGADSTAKRIASSMPGVTDVSAAGDGSILVEAVTAWGAAGHYPRRVDPWGPDAMARRVAALFDRALAHATRGEHRLRGRSAR